MKTNVMSPWAVLAAAMLAAGCSGLTPSAQTQLRIQEKNASYQTLNEHQRNDVLGGAIERGNSPDQVYMALGKPTKIVTSADGIKAMWVYVEYYSPKAVAGLSMNNPNSSHYRTDFIVNPNTPVHGGEGTHAAGDFMKPALNDLGFALDLPDLQSKTVYVFFHLGKVTEIKLDGDSSDQKTAAPNVAPQKNTQQVRAFHVI